MTVEEALKSKKILLSATEAGSLLGMHPQTLNLMARQKELPFRFIPSGCRVKYPRIPLLRWLGLIEGGNDSEEVQKMQEV